MGLLLAPERRRPWAIRPAPCHLAATAAGPAGAAAGDAAAAAGHAAAGPTHAAAPAGHATAAGAAAVVADPAGRAVAAGADAAGVPVAAAPEAEAPAPEAAEVVEVAVTDAADAEGQGVAARGWELFVARAWLQDGKYQMRHALEKARALELRIAELTGLQKALKNAIRSWTKKLKSTAPGKRAGLLELFVANHPESTRNISPMMSPGLKRKLQRDEGNKK